ncbi:MAG: hypothetical protein JXR77_06110 [Lentisphaeria bacterium]|nr:hypothetical protein [Lentisphaeria bacterium]
MVLLLGPLLWTLAGGCCRFGELGSNSCRYDWMNPVASPPTQTKDQDVRAQRPDTIPLPDLEAGMAREEALRCTPLHICLMPGVAWPFANSHVTGLRLGLVAPTGEDCVDGLDLGVIQSGKAMRGLSVSIANAGEGEAVGVSVGGLVQVSGDLLGLQLGGLVPLPGAVVDGDATGAQVCPSMGVIGGNLRGVQVTGLVGEAQGVAGVQLAGVSCLTDRIAGAQLALLWNEATTVRGMQLGIWNRCQRLDGIQIGLINVVGARDNCRWMPLVNAGF